MRRHGETPVTAEEDANHTLDVLIFDLFGVIARCQSREIADVLEARAGAPGRSFWEAYWTLRPPYDRAEVSAVDYWESVGQRVGIFYNHRLKQDLIANDVSSWATVNDEMVACPIQHSV